MTKLHSIGVLGMMVCALSGAWGQDNSTNSTPPATEPPATEAPQNGQPPQPVPAYGQENAPPPISENPPLSGLDLPSLEPHSAPLSYLQPGATVSESADTNAGNSLGGQQVTSVSRALGSVTLQRLWSHYDLALDYVGGVGYYNIHGQGLKSLQQLDMEQKINWKRGQFSVRDSFSYLPEGNFGGSYGSLGSQGIGSLGSTSFGLFANGTALGTLGLAPRILNVSLAEIQENLTPKSAITVAGGYAFTHFYGSGFDGTSFIGSSQTSAQAGYNRILSSHTQIALVYGYQGFDFSVVGTAFHTQIVQGLYGHRISGRMDLLLGAGPQLTFIDTQSATIEGTSIVPITVKNTRLGVAAQARLRYQLSRTALDLTYRRFTTSGSGLFAGAQSDIVHLTATRPLTRVWSVFTDIGYSHNSRVQPLSEQQVTQCSLQSPPFLDICPANNANSYSYGYVGGGLHRAFGRNLHGYVSYQFNELSFDHQYCVTGTVCSRISNRSVATFGLDWTPRPIRLD
jgi:hypothetical protein